MHRLILISVPFTGLGFFSSSAQNTSSTRDSINRYTQIDFLEMKKTLGIQQENRPGPSGNPEDANAANFDENQVRDYTLPPLMTTRSGMPVNSATDWENFKRPELIAIFEQEMYGELPDDIPPVSWSIKSQKDTLIAGIPIAEQHLVGTVDNSLYPELSVTIEAVLGIPKSEKNTAIPVLIRFGFLNVSFGKTKEPSSYFISPFEPGFKQQLAYQGWGYAILYVSFIQADHGAGLNAGIIGLVNQGESRSATQWGALRAWAWGASTLLDYFETRSDVDSSRIAVEGTSRYGKAALVAMVFDTRISLGFIGSSGAGGASLLRRNFGEMLENLASPADYHWFAGNFLKYASIKTADDLPVDAHQLIALCVP